MAKKQSIAVARDDETGEIQPRIRRGRVDSLDLYEITEHELGLLETGSPSSVHLNFAIAFISIGISLFFSLFTAKVESDRVYFTFVIFITISAVAGSVLMAIWYRSSLSMFSVVQRIRARMPAEDSRVSVHTDSIFVASEAAERTENS